MSKMAVTEPQESTVEFREGREDHWRETVAQDENDALWLIHRLVLIGWSARLKKRERQHKKQGGS